MTWGLKALYILRVALFVWVAYGERLQAFVYRLDEFSSVCVGFLNLNNCHGGTLTKKVEMVEV